jgi:hypothetical protein
MSSAKSIMNCVQFMTKIWVKELQDNGVECSTKGEQMLMMKSEVVYHL